LKPNIDRASKRTGKWTADKESKLKGLVQTHGGKNWKAISALVLGRAEKQCQSICHDINIDQANGRFYEIMLSITYLGCFAYLRSLDLDFANKVTCSIRPQ
jgi:hypothetical protein